VVVERYGAFIGKTSERLVVREQKRVVAEVPFADLEQLTIATGGAAISVDAIRACVEHGVQINFLSGAGRPYAKVTSPTLLGTVVTRREQMLAYTDRRGVEIARAVVEGKVRNQVNVLKYFAKHRRRADPALYDRIYAETRSMTEILTEAARLDGERIDDLRAQFLSVEGRAARRYWDLVGAILGTKVEFPGREHRGAADPLNAMLNYGYGILYGEGWGALLLAGLEPFAGFLHVDRPGKPSLVLDFVEQFRQQVVDRPVVAALSRGYQPKLVEGRLDEASRREVARLVRERLESSETHQGKKHRLKTVVHLQARALAGFLRGEGKYRAFVGAW